MDIVWEILWDALKDALLVLPFLFVVYLLIEFIEQKLMFARKAKHLLRGKFAPLIGTGMGLIPQCGFSVMATNLYLSNNLTIGTLIAVFISTSDEAIPILLGSGADAWKLLPILGVKVVYALLMGYLLDFIFRKKNAERLLQADEARKHRLEEHEHESDREGEIYDPATGATLAVTEGATGEVVEVHDEHHHHAHDGPHDHDHEGHEHQLDEDGDEHEVEMGCCHHKLEHTGKMTKKEAIKAYLLHPFVHSLKVFAYVLLINIAFGTLIYFVGEDKIAAFLESSGFWQPFVAGLVGLIPNCAASVIIAQLYALGGLTFGSCVTGLSVNAGIAIALLFRKNKNWKESLFIVGVLYLSGVILGIALTPIVL
ncbi:MAG: arsenic efflux protein [Clostridia bacterium]|nr:arsenic efflux protein [Clostridia bacterium]